jgi:hypothetical protein
MVRSVPHVPDKFAHQHASERVDVRSKSPHFCGWRGGRAVEGAPLLRDVHSPEPLGESCAVVRWRCSHPQSSTLVPG